MAKTERPDIKIGDRIFRLYSQNVYRVVGETTRSWLIRFDGQYNWMPSTKIPKCGLPEGWVLSEQAWQDHQFAVEHRYRIAQALQRASPEQIRKVAALIGYTHE